MISWSQSFKIFVLNFQELFFQINVYDRHDKGFKIFIVIENDRYKIKTRFICLYERSNKNINVKKSFQQRNSQKLLLKRSKLTNHVSRFDFVSYKLFMARVLEFIERTFQIHSYKSFLRRQQRLFSTLDWNETQHFAANYTRQLLTDSVVRALSYIKLDFFFAPTATAVAFCLFTARFMTLTATSPNINRTVPPLQIQFAPLLRFYTLSWVSFLLVTDTTEKTILHADSDFEASFSGNFREAIR